MALLRNNKFRFSLLGSLGLLLLPVVAFAVEDPDVTQLYAYLGGFYNRLLLPIGTVLAGLVIMFGGISYAMSAGEPSKVQKAKEYIFGAISGEVLLIGAALIVKTILQ
jgi:hypothetical protein